MNGSYSERQGRKPPLDVDGLIQFVFGELARFKGRDYFWEAFNSYELRGEEFEARIPDPKQYVITELGRPGIWKWLDDPERVVGEGDYPPWNLDTLFDVVELFHNVIVAAPMYEPDGTFEGYSQKEGRREFREAINKGLALGDPPAELTEDGRIVELSTGRPDSPGVKSGTDVFISHVHEPGDDTAEQLAESLAERGFQVSVGDARLGGTSAGSRSRVVILGPEFLAGEWPQAELDALAEREPADGRPPIILVSRGIESSQVQAVDPALAERSELSIDLGLDRVVDAIARAVQRGGDDGPRVPGAGAEKEDSRSFADRHSLLVGTSIALVVTIAGTFVAGLLLGWFGSDSGSTPTVIREVGTSAREGSAGSGKKVSQAERSSGPVVEYADNRNGSPVFAGPEGATVEEGSEVIPYGTKVEASCFAENKSGMASVNGFYLIATGEWKGDYVVANTMTNGGAIGDRTSPGRDPRVKTCEAGE